MASYVAPIGAHQHIQSDREHGQQWLTCLSCGAQWHDTDPLEQVSEGDGSCDAEASMRELQTHWSYGGGSAGCLYDFGPNYAETKGQALDALAQMYELTDAERATLDRDCILYFDASQGSAVNEPSLLYSRRIEVGADYCELSEQDGPCPEGE